MSICKPSFSFTTASLASLIFSTHQTSTSFSNPYDFINQITPNCFHSFFDSFAFNFIVWNSDLALASEIPIITLNLVPNLRINLIKIKFADIFNSLANLVIFQRFTANGTVSYWNENLKLNFEERSREIDDWKCGIEGLTIICWRKSQISL